ncbi:MAG: NAD(P)-dependent oxidoreductase [Bacteroidota bacterium]
MKILVTGSNGHLGEALIRHLKTTKHEVVGTDILASPITKYVGDLKDATFVEKCMSGVEAILHTATLHKPHVVTHSKQSFIDTNISGTLNLLEAANRQNVKAFVFTSTTSTFGDAMQPTQQKQAVWVTEDLTPIPKNIYGVTKVAAEQLCQLFHRNHNLPCLILRTSRFFAEVDDNPKLRNQYEDANIKVNEFTHRRVDIQDVVDAHVLAVRKAPIIGFGKYIISATTPFDELDLVDLQIDAVKVLQRKYPIFEEVYRAQGWNMFPTIGRVYVNQLARTELGWQPKYDFGYILNRLHDEKAYRSPLSELIGAKGYHSESFGEAPYPV